LRRYLPHLILAVGVIVRLAAAPHEGHHGDEMAFVRWCQQVMTFDIGDFYANTDCNYPPIWVYLLALIGHGMNALGLDMTPGGPTLRVMLKLPQILADIGIFYLIWWQFLRALSWRAQAAWSAAIALNPALIFLSAIWTQIDPLMALPLVAAVVVYARGRPVLAFVCVALSLLVKPLALPCVPIVFIAIYRRYGWKPVAWSIVAGFAVTVAVMLPMNLHQSPLLLLDLATRSSKWYPYTSLDAFNVWALAGFWQDDRQVFAGLTYAIWGYALFGIAYLSILPATWRRSDVRGLLGGMTLAMLCLFLFPTKSQERYIYLPAVLGLVWAILDAWVLPYAAILTVTTFLNVHYRVRVPGERTPGIKLLAMLHNTGVTTCVCLAANLLSFGAMWARQRRTSASNAE
jgi:Gpi18-like mannosyltransferase